MSRMNPLDYTRQREVALPPWTVVYVTRWCRKPNRSGLRAEQSIKYRGQRAESITNQRRARC